MAEKKLPVFVESALGVASQLELKTQVKIWKEAEEKLAAAKATELELRTALVEKWFPNFVEGTNTGQLREDNLKCVMPMNRNVDQDQYSEAWAWATKEETAPRLRLRALLELVFKQKVDLSVGAWKELSNDDRKKLADIVTEKPGTPSLKLEPRK
jgi:hypothetical protein